MSNTDTLSNRLFDYEEGELSFEDTVDLFQELVDSGMAWQLQGSYGRMAAQLIADGWVIPPDDNPDA